MITAAIDRFFIKKPFIRRLVTKLLYGEKTVWVDLLGIKLFVHSLLENGYYRASKLSTHSSLYRDELAVLVRLANRISNETCFVDVGANVGVFSALYSGFKNIYPDFKIYAFEVNPSTFIRLQENAKYHGFCAFNIGLGKEEGGVDFVEGAVSHVTTRRDLENSYTIKSKVFRANIIPLCNFSFSKKLIIKIDVEGQEFEVLEGAESYFALGQVDSVYLDGYADARCWDFLERYGFVLLDGRTFLGANRDTFSLFAVRM